MKEKLKGCLTAIVALPIVILGAFIVCIATVFDWTIGRWFRPKG